VLDYLIFSSVLQCSVLFIFSWVFSDIVILPTIRHFPDLIKGRLSASAPITLCFSFSLPQTTINPYPCSVNIASSAFSWMGEDCLTGHTGMVLAVSLFHSPFSFLEGNTIKQSFYMGPILYSHFLNSKQWNNLKMEISLVCATSTCSILSC
jgi:hypothetical protein